MAVIVPSWMKRGERKCSVSIRVFPFSNSFFPLQKKKRNTYAGIVRRPFISARFSFSTTVELKFRKEKKFNWFYCFSHTLHVTDICFPLLLWLHCACQAHPITSSVQHENNCDEPNQGSCTPLIKWSHCKSFFFTQIQNQPSDHRWAWKNPAPSKVCRQLLPGRPWMVRPTSNGRTRALSEAAAATRASEPP